MSKTRKKAYIALFVSSFFWGLTPPIIKYSLNYISPVSLLFFRCLIASLIFLIPMTMVIKKIKPTISDWLKYLFLGFLSTPLYLYLYSLGVNMSSAIDVSLISIVVPIFIIIGGAIFLHENITKREIFGTILAIAGTMVLTIFPFSILKNFSSKNILGNLIIIFCGLIWTYWTLLSKINKNKRLNPFLLSSFSFVVGFFCLLPFYFKENFNNFVFSKSVIIHPRAIPGIIFLAVFSSVVAYSTYVYGLKKIEASEAIIFKYLQPIFSIPASILLLGENLKPFTIIGSILIAIGVYFCEKKGKIFPSFFRG